MSILRDWLNTTLTQVRAFLGLPVPPVPPPTPPGPQRRTPAWTADGSPRPSLPHAFPRVVTPAPIAAPPAFTPEPEPPVDDEPPVASAPPAPADDPPEPVDPADPAAADADDPTPDAEPPLDLPALLESLLFVAGEPVTAAVLARALALPEAEVTAGLTELGLLYRQTGRGLRLQTLHDRYQLVTAPAAGPLIETFLNLDTSPRLSAPALETLAVIAYRGPVTRAQVEAVRGVDCAGVLRTLTQRGLITESGRLESVGRPILYTVTELFLQHFGLAALTDLPPLPAADADRLRAATILGEEEI